MLKRFAQSRLLTLVVGISVGFAAAQLYATGRSDDNQGEQELPSAEAVVAQAVAPLPAPTEQVEDSMPAEPATVGTSTAEFDEDPTDGAAAPTATPESSDVVAARSIQARLDDEAAARRRLDAELATVKRTLLDLEDQLGTLLQARQEAEEQSERQVRRRQVDASTLVEAGFDSDEATFLADRWGQQQMALLELRDEATREGWVETPRFEEAARAVRSGPESMREELDEDSYERFLFSIGRSNRVTVEGVIPSSPAQAIGLEQGDVIVRYDGNRVYSGHDLRAAIAAGEGDLPATLEIDRDGETYELELPRGPIGVSVGAKSVEP